MTTFKIYEIKSYSNWTNKRIEKEYELNDLIPILQNQNKEYHQKIDPTKSYQFFGDCDKYQKTFNDFAKILIDFLDKYYNIQINENQVIQKINQLMVHFIIQYHHYMVHIRS
jgi:hypothetical protein